MKYHQGLYKPQNPKKYVGDPNNIIYRSGLELKVMERFDLHSNIIRWASEEVAIPYISPLDNQIHHYFADFIVTQRKEDGTLETFMVEIKPEKQTQEPKKQAKKTKRYLTEVKDWLINKAKWNAAQAFCEEKGWGFIIMTDRHITGKRYKPYKPYRKYKKNGHVR